MRTPRPLVCIAGILCALTPVLPACGQHRDAVPAAPEAGSASLSGTVEDPDGDALPGARVEVISGNKTYDEVADSDGNFHVSGLPAGSYELHVVADGFEETTERGRLDTSEQRDIDAVQMRPAAAEAVSVVASTHDIASAQIAGEMTQRVLGVVPNFYVVYYPNPAPLTSGQKFHLAWRSTLDPVTFLGTGFVAGYEQAGNEFPGYGHGAIGYARRYGASFADGSIATFLGGYLFPSILHQDPRYFYQGTGSVTSRAKHAALSVVICRGDNGRMQFNASNVLGDFASAGISNAYYPASDRHGVGLTLQNAGVGMLFGAFAAIMQEFVVPKLTPHRPGLTPKAASGVPEDGF